MKRVRAKQAEPVAWADEHVETFVTQQSRVEPVAWRKDLNPPNGNWTLQWQASNPWPGQNHVQPLYAAPPAVQAEPVANLHDNKTAVTEPHPMLSATHFCRDCRALWRQCDDFTFNLRSNQCCDKCNNAPTGEQLIPLSSVSGIAALIQACNRLSDEAEEYDFDDGMGRGALQTYWDDFEAALERARESLND